MYSFPLKPRWPEVEEFLALSALIHQIHLSASSSDFRAWSLSPSEIFSVSSFFLAPNSPFPDFPYTHKTMWFALTPWKVQAFLWKIAWSRTPNWDVIQSFYPQFPLSKHLFPLLIDGWIQCPPVFSLSFCLEIVGQPPSNGQCQLGDTGQQCALLLLLERRIVQLEIKELMDSMSSCSHLGVLEGMQ